MLVGKRPSSSSPIMKRTTSMSGGMAVDTQTSNLEPHLQEIISEDNIIHPHHTAPYGYYDEQRLAGMVASLSPTPTNNIPQTHNQTNIHTPDFLRTCGLCKSRLAPGRDIYMYRGDTAFCSFECREKQMKQDQRKEKWKVASNKEDHRRASPSTATAKASTKTETAACT
ncbi:hypothetical protein VNO77_43905 [Canavalia gladiata]|uniref:FLZ-type domain-containing protein n=1 Tax=Canavalia gladiata TaxID=3824 RepID=A0AAN9PPW1_CANGL